MAKGTKTCDRCGNKAPVEMFYRSAITEDGLFGSCMDCCRTNNPRRSTTRTESVRYSAYMDASRGALFSSRGPSGAP